MPASIGLTAPNAVCSFCLSPCGNRFSTSENPGSAIESGFTLLCLAIHWLNSTPAFSAGVSCLVVVVSVHVIVVPGGNLLTDCSNALDMNALPKPPGCFNVLGVTDGNCGWAVLLGGLPDACAVKPSRIGLPGLGSIGGGVVSGGGGG